MSPCEKLSMAKIRDARRRVAAGVASYAVRSDQPLNKTILAFDP